MASRLSVSPLSLRSRPDRLTFAVGILAVACSLVLGVSAYSIARDRAHSRAPTHVERLARVAAGNPEAAAGDQLELERGWDDLPTRYRHAYLCVIGPDGRLLRHTGAPERVGEEVASSLLPGKDGAGDATVGDLIQARRRWSGRLEDAQGASQIVAYEPASEGNRLVSVHVPLASIEESVRAEALPWVVAFGAVSFLLLPALVLLHLLLSRHARTAQSAVVERATKGVFGRHEQTASLPLSPPAEALGTLATGMAHDFSQALLVMRGFCELLAHRVEGDQEALRDLRSLSNGIDHAEGVVERILGFVRDEEPMRQEVDLGDALHEAVDLVRPILDERIEVLLTLDHDARTIVANPRQLHQAFLNMLTNAAHSMQGQPGEIRVHTSLVHAEKRDAGSFVAVRIQDSGCGIPSESLMRIFEPHFTTKTDCEGHGIGLPVARNIVESLGGFIDVESRPGVGTTFSLHFPVPCQERSDAPGDERSYSLTPASPVRTRSPERDRPGSNVPTVRER